MSTIKILYDNGIEKEYKSDWKKSDLNELYNSIYNSMKDKINGVIRLTDDKKAYLINISKISSISFSIDYGKNEASEN